MMQRLSIAKFLGCLIDHIEQETGVKCYDDPDGKASPLYSVQLVKAEPANTKTMFVDVFEVWVHCIAAPVKPHSNAPVLNMVDDVERALLKEFDLPEPFSLFNSEYQGVQTLKKDESGEGHAVLSCRFHICYGFRCK